MNLVDFVPNSVPIGADKIFNGEGTRTCGYLRNKFIFFAGAARAKFFFIKYNLLLPIWYIDTLVTGMLGTPTLRVSKKLTFY